MVAYPRSHSHHTINISLLSCPDIIVTLREIMTIMSDTRKAHDLIKGVGFLSLGVQWAVTSNVPIIRVVIRDSVVITETDLDRHAERFRRSFPRLCTTVTSCP